MFNQIPSKIPIKRSDILKIMFLLHKIPVKLVMDKDEKLENQGAEKPNTNSKTSTKMSEEK